MRLLPRLLLLPSLQLYIDRRTDGPTDQPSDRAIDHHQLDDRSTSKRTNTTKRTPQTAGRPNRRDVTRRDGTLIIVETGRCDVPDNEHIIQEINQQRIKLLVVVEVEGKSQV